MLWCFSLTLKCCVDDSDIRKEQRLEAHTNQISCGEECGDGIELKIEIEVQ